MEAQDKKNVEYKIKSSKGTEGRLEHIKDIQPADEINQNDVQKSVLSVGAPVGTEGSGMAALEASQYQVDVKRRPDDLLNNNSSSTVRFPIDSVVLGFDAVEDDGSDSMKMEDEEEESGLASISASSHSLASICSSADVEALLAEAASECSPEAPASDATSRANGGTVAGGDGATTSVGPVAASADLSVAAVACGQPRLDNKDLSSSGKAQRNDKVYGNVEAATHGGSEMEGGVSAQEDRGSALQCLLTGLRGVTQSAAQTADKFALPQRVHQIAEVYAQKQEYDEAIRFIEAERLWLERALQGLTTTLQCWKDARKELGEAARRSGVGGAPGSSLPTLPEYEFEGLLAACRSHRQIHNAADAKQEETFGEALEGVVSLETATQSTATMANQVNADATKSISSPSSPPQLLDDSPPGSLQDAMERQAVTEPINGACKSLELDTEGISTTTEEHRVAVAQAAEGSTSGAHVNHGTAWDTELLDAQTSPKVQGPAEDQRPLESTVKFADLGSALYAPGEVIVSRVAAVAGAASQKLLRDGSPPTCLDVRCGESSHVMRMSPPTYALQPEEADEAGEGPPEALATEPSCPSPAASADGLVETACGHSESRGSRVAGATIDSLTEPMAGEEEDPEREEETKEEPEEDEEEEEEESMEPKAMARCTLATNEMRLQEGDEMAELDEEAKRIKIEQWARPQNLTSILKKRGSEGSVKDGADRCRTGRRVRFTYPDNSAIEPDTEEGGASCLLLLLLMLGTVLVSVLGTAFYCYLFADSDVERTLGDSDAAATAQACADFRAQTKVYYGRAARCLSATAEALQHCLSAASGWLSSHLNATSV